jgi:hypothetical protein
MHKKPEVVICRGEKDRRHLYEPIFWNNTNEQHLYEPTSTIQPNILWKNTNEQIKTMNK